MRRFIVAAIGSAVLAVVVPAANASGDSEYEREGWAALERASVERTEANVSRPSAEERAGMPFEQSELDRALVGIPEYEYPPVLVAQIGGLSHKSGEADDSPFATDHNFIAPAP